MADDKGSMPERWRYSPEITLGHIIQAATLVIMIGGGAVTSYLSLRTDIQSIRERSAVDMADLNARVLARLADVSSRVLAIEVGRVADHNYQIEMKTRVDRLIDAVADIRVQIGKRSDATP